jgi:hypothetical protein
MVLFSGTNTHEESTAIYKRWLEEYKGLIVSQVRRKLIAAPR